MFAERRGARYNLIQRGQMKSTEIMSMIAAMLMVANSALSQTWTPTTAPNEHWQAVASSADGSKLIAGSEGLLYAISTNSGSTWITNSQPQYGSYYGSWSFVASSADGSILVGIIANEIWVSTNSGTTWFSNSVPVADFFASVALSADGTKLVIVDGKQQNYPGVIYTSTNFGVTVAPTMAPTNYWQSVASSADGTKLVAAEMNFSSQCGSIYASTNSGLTWGLTGAPTNNAWGTVASSVDGSKLLAASQTAYIPAQIYGGVYTSTNFGMTWTSNCVPAAQWESVASSADGTRLVAVAIEPKGWIYTSTNSGITWVSNSVPNDSWVSVASSADGGKMVVAPLGDQSFKPQPIYTLQTTPSPQLNLIPSSDNLVLSWGIPSTNFVLQQSADLTLWATATNLYSLNLTNLRNQMTLLPSSSSTFYRLKTP